VATVNRGDLLDPGLLALLALLRVGLEPIGSEGLESNEDPGREHLDPTESTEQLGQACGKRAIARDAPKKMDDKNK